MSDTRQRMSSHTVSWCPPTGPAWRSTRATAGR